MKKSICLVMTLVFLGIGQISAQKNKDDNILTLSIVKEPVILQKNRIQVKTGYQYEMYWKHFIGNGQPINAVDYGQVGCLNRYNYQISYGLTEYLQIGLQQGLLSGFIGYGTSIKDYYDEIINTTSLNSISGFSDMLFNIGYRLPINLKAIEIAIFPGFYIPTNHDPNEPVYDVIKNTKDEKTWINVDQTTNEKAGNGALRLELATMVKFRFNEKIAFQIYGKYNFPISTSNTIFWKTIYDSENYHQIPVDCVYSPKQELFGNLELQVVPDKKEIMGLTLGANLLNSLNEWSKFDNLKVKDLNSSLCRLYTGIELVVTEKVRFNQQFFYDVTGRNSNGSIGMQSSFVFNFLRHEK